MSTNLEEQARGLAARPYAVEVMQDETTDGQPIYLLTHPELLGCMAQGRTIEEAKSSLEEARVEYILSLLEDGLPVPDPEHTATMTTSSGGGTVPTYRGSYRAPTTHDVLTDEGKTARDSTRRKLFEVVPQT